MMRRYLGIVLVSLFVCSSAFATITVDGDVSDWAAGQMFVDVVDDGEGEAEMVGWGTIIEGGTLYGYIEMDTSIATYASGNNDLWAGLYIDVDNTGSADGVGQTTGAYIDQPSALDQSVGVGSKNTGEEWANGVHMGYDIAIEWGVNTGHWGEGYNFWGSNIYAPSAPEDHASSQGSAITSGATASSGNIIEFSCSVTEILGELGLYPDDVTAGGIWKIGARAEASINEAGVWGSDNSDTVVLIADTAILRGDADLDGDIDADDLATWGANYTGAVASDRIWATGDFDGDGDVDADDLATWGANYTGVGGGGSMTAVPEPVTMSLLALGGAALVRRRRK